MIKKLVRSLFGIATAALLTFSLAVPAKAATIKALSINAFLDDGIDTS